MRRSVFLTALLFLVGAISTQPATAAIHHRIAGQPAKFHASLSSQPRTQTHSLSRHSFRHTATYVPVRTARGVAHLVRTSRHHPHTASRLHHARRHGTAAVQAAAREAQVDAAQTQAPADQPQETASLKLPLAPIHVMNLPPLRGSRESLMRQNTRADQEGLARIRDDADIVTLLHSGLLVALPTGSGMHADPRLPENRRYCRPWTAHFLADLSRAHFEQFHDSLQINSAVRTVEYQRHLIRINGNAAPAEGDTASPHLTGATIDIAKKGLSAAQVAWMRSYLLPLENSGKVDVEEEFYQSCFHISVYQTYHGATPPEVALETRAAAMLASRLR